MEKEYDIKKAAKHMDTIFNSSTDAQFGGFINILSKLFKNIINKPNVDKFRSVRHINQT